MRGRSGLQRTAALWVPLRVLATVCVATTTAALLVAASTGRYSWQLASADGTLAPATGSRAEYRAGHVAGLDAAAGVKPIDSQLFKSLLASAAAHPRRRRMVDLTREPATNQLQSLINTWMEGSYSPVHRHDHHAESFVVLEGVLAFFTFRLDDGRRAPAHVTCHLLGPHVRTRGIIVEQREWHAMAAAPASLGYPGHAIVLETSGHVFDPYISTKVLAPWTVSADSANGDPHYFETLLPLCARADVQAETPDSGLELPENS